MKLKLIIFSILFLGGLCCYANPSILSTPDRKCYFVYPSFKNMQGWFFKKTGNCSFGKVHGRDKIRLYNAFGQPTEEIEGIFSHGYWTDILISNKIETFSHEDGVYKLTFVLEESEQGTFIGQLISKPIHSSFYSMFTFCSPVRILLKARKKDLLHEKNRQELIEKVKSLSTKFCSEVKKILLFVSFEEDIKPDNVFLYAEILPSFHKNKFYSIPEKKDELLFEEDVSEKSDKIQVEKLKLRNIYYLLLESWIEDKPIKGRTIVHIDENLEVDFPFSMKVVGNISQGWGILEGDIFKSGANQIPVIQVYKWIPCIDKTCSEKKTYEEVGLF